MAAGAFVFYQHFLEDWGRRLFDLVSNTYVMTFVSSGYTPSPQSHSNYTANILPSIVTAAGFLEVTLTGLTWSRPDNSRVAWDANDITHSATGLINAKYGVIYEFVTKRPVGYFDVETTVGTGLNVNQLVTQWNANGIARLSNPA